MVPLTLPGAALAKARKAAKQDEAAAEEAG